MAADPKGTPATDFGEPWEMRRGFLVDRYGDVLGSLGHDDRARACVNAMQGIADPEAWVRDSASAHTALSLVSGALADAGLAVGPALEFGDRVREMAGQRDAAINALCHMRWCASCAQGEWTDCEQGRIAAAIVERATAGARREIEAEP